MKKQRFTKDLDRLDAEGNERGNEGRGTASLACDQLGDLRQPEEEKHGGMEDVETNG